MVIFDLKEDDNLDILFLTETRLQDHDDETTIHEMILKCFFIKHIRRKELGGGVTMIYRNNLTVELLTHNVNIMEHSDVTINCQRITMPVVYLYRLLTI